MSLKASDKVDTNRYELEVEVSAEDFEKALQKAYLKEKNKIAIPGFRKGKAPRAFIEKYYGQEFFFEKAVNDVYPEALDAAIAESGLEVIDDKMDLDVVSISKEEGIVFKAAVTVKPEVEISDYKGLEVTKKPTEVTDEDVENEIKKVQDRNSRLVVVEDRPAESGDVAVIDFEGFVDGVAFEGGKSEGHSLNLGAGQFIPGFEDQVIGHNSGEEFDINVTFPEEYQAEELAGKEAVFKIKLHEIKMRELPEVDDEFVKDISEFDTLDEYKADVKKKLEEAREHEAKDDLDNQLIDQLVDLLKAEIPDAMFENRVSEGIREFSYRLQSQGLDIDSYMKYTGLDNEAFRASFRPQAERQVKTRLALEKIAELEKLEASEEEISAEYQKMAEAYKMEVEKIKTVISERDLVKDIVVEKAIDLVRNSAVIK